MPPVLRLGIVGLGLASTFMIPQLARDPRIKLAGAADVRQDVLDVFAREFDFLINLKTAEALGLTVPQHVLLQATEVIQ